MRKVDRLFEIVQLLRGRRLRTAEFMASELGVSVRTIYRDIAGLMASGIPIEGERGVGYLISQPIEMPPLRFTSLELKALKLGADLVQAIADKEIAAAAVEASHKIADALPENRNIGLQSGEVNVFFKSAENLRERLLFLRNAIDDQEKLSIEYMDKREENSKRIIRPLGLEYWSTSWTCSAWCELRDDFRIFRIDRISNYQHSGEKFVNEPGKTYQDLLKREKDRLSV